MTSALLNQKVFSLKNIGNTTNQPSNSKPHKITYIGFLFFAVSLLNGCASDAPVISTDHATFNSHPKSHKHLRQFKGHKQAYNRPYRIKGKTYYPMADAHGYSEVGIASWYGSESGSKTSMGRHFSPNALSAAHKTLPLPSKVRVTNLHNGRSVVLTVNDRGPFKHNRIIDLSHGAAKTIGLHGVAKVKVDYLGSAE